MKLNTKAPTFSLPDSNGKNVSLQDFLGKYVVVYFYPKDNTTGCTQEGIDFTKALPQFTKLNTVIIGISPDSPASHLKFITKQNLKHILLSDEQKKVLEKYDVWKEKSMYGRKYMGVVRSTFLIDPKGNLVFAWEKVSVPNHVNDVLKKIKEL